MSISEPYAKLGTPPLGVLHAFGLLCGSVLQDRLVDSIVIIILGVLLIGYVPFQFVM